MLVSLSVPVLGLYLVFATLIAPAILRAAFPALTMTRTVMIGTVAYVLGLLLSIVLDLPGGPCVVLSMVVISLGATLSINLPGQTQIDPEKSTSTQ